MNSDIMKDRNPILSFLLSLCLSGLGQLYNGELKKAILFVFLIFPLYLILGLAGVLSNFTGFVMHVMLIFGYKLFVAYDAYRVSKKLRPYELKQINNIWIYLLFAVLSYAVIWYGVQLNRNLIGYDSFSLPTPSMLPTIEVDDKIWATDIRPEDVRHGDIITFKREDGQTYISRVVALENENVEIKDDRVIVDNEEEVHKRIEKTSDDTFDYLPFEVVTPSQTKHNIYKIEKYMGRDFPPQKTSNMEMITVPDDHVYVVSDNRNNGMDSRFYGAIPIKNVDKVVQFIWWSKNWSKIGKNLNQN